MYQLYCLYCNHPIQPYKTPTSGIDIDNGVHFILLKFNVEHGYVILKIQLYLRFLSGQKCS